MHGVTKDKNVVMRSWFYYMFSCRSCRVLLIAPHWRTVDMYLTSLNSISRF